MLILKSKSKIRKIHWKLIFILCFGFEIIQLIEGENNTKSKKS